MELDWPVRQRRLPRFSRDPRGICVMVARELLTPRPGTACMIVVVARGACRGCSMYSLLREIRHGLFVELRLAVTL